MSVVEIHPALADEVIGLVVAVQALKIVCACVFVGSCLVTKVFISNLLATGRGWVIIT